MAKGILWGSDLYKGAKFSNASIFKIGDIRPFQRLEQDEKTPEWLHAVADHFEAVGWRNVERKAGKIQRNYWLRHGKLNPADYSLVPTENEYHETIGLLLPSDSPLTQFHPIIPPIVDSLRGEFIKRNTTFHVEQVDPGAVSEALEQKNTEFLQTLQSFFVTQKQYELARQGITPDKNNQEMFQQYMQEQQKAVEEFSNTQAKFKSFRTTGALWAEKVVKVQESRYNLKELETEGFEASLIGDREFWHLDMLEDTFKLDLLNPKWCDYHKGPNVKYVSEGDYFLWFDWGSTGDIINTFGNKISEEDYKKLKDIYATVVGSLVVPDYAKSIQGAYYDNTQNWHKATDLNPAMNDALLGKELAYNFSPSANFIHNQDADIFSGAGVNGFNGEPHMFRIMHLYWRSLKKIGWLTKIGRDGVIDYMDWVTEDFHVTVEPKYDNSIRKDKTKENLIYGEHIDWTWVNDWRRIIKISPNQKHSFWVNNDQFSSIYIDGGPCPFQFKGKNNPYESKPPVEGCEFSYINSTSHSLVDRLKSFQILHNIAMNKIPEAMLSDMGNKIAIDRRSITTSSASIEAGLDPVGEYADRLRNTDILTYGPTRETLEGLGQAAVPQILNLSTWQQAQGWMQVGQQLKDLAGEAVGINRNRQGQSKPSETATNAQSNITYSETQTEKLFEQHAQLMERVRQRMLDAAQYYSTFKDVSREMYMNDREENVFLEMVGMENLLPHYNLKLTSTASTRAMLQQLSQFLIQENTLPFKPHEKIEAIVSESVPQILQLMRKGEVEAQQQQELEHQREMELQQQKHQQGMEQQAALDQQQKDKAVFDRETQIEVATIRALGGVQTDNNKDSLPDAKTNLDAYFKQQQLQKQQEDSQSKLDFEKQKHSDNTLLSREAQQAAIQKEKVKGEYALQIAKENKSKFDK